MLRAEIHASRSAESCCLLRCSRTPGPGRKAHEGEPQPLAEGRAA